MITADKKMVAVNMHPALYQSLTARAEHMKMSLAEVLETAVVEWLSETRENVSGAPKLSSKQHHPFQVK